jgi:D-glycero-alpha-D-manno-heptose-7-phosphate kinase
LIISKTPLRASLLGGGLDYKEWFLEHGGAVISTAINHYCYVILHEGKVHVFWDLPTKAGLATSSAFTVGLLRVCTELDQKTIAQLATVWESDKLNGNIGYQDQYICSLGGFRLLRFSEAGIRDTRLNVDWLEPYLMLFNTHQYRKAGEIVVNQLKEINKHTKVYERMQEVVEEGLLALNLRDFNLFGKLLDESWQLKRQLSEFISTPKIDDIYTRALSKGAIGGKLLGAGGGGFMLFLAEPDKQEAIKNELTECEYVPFKFEPEGTRIVYKE